MAKTNDFASLVFTIDVSDSAMGTDKLESIAMEFSVSDAGSGSDSVNMAGAFFVVDSNNILQPLGVLISRDNRLELLPATRDYTEEIPGRHGEIDFGTELKPRVLELQVNTQEGMPVDKAKLQRLFAKYLDPTKGAKTLIFANDVEKTYKVKYSGQIDITEYANWFRFVIPFKMSESFIVASFEKSLTGSGALVNDGTADTGLIIEIAGSATNPSVRIGNETLTYTGTIPSDQKLVIDTEKQTAKIGSNNALANFNGVFPLLSPGETSVVTSNNVLIKWRDKWI